MTRLLQRRSIKPNAATIPKFHGPEQILRFAITATCHTLPHTGRRILRGVGDMTKMMKQGFRSLACMLVACAAALSAPAAAQDKGSVNPKPLAPLAHPEDPKTPAKELFGRKATPTKATGQTIGFY